MPNPTKIPAWFHYAQAGYNFGCTEDVQQWLDEHIVLAKVVQRVDNNGLYVTEIEPGNVPNKLFLI